MALNAGQSPEDSLYKIKLNDIIELNFEKISKTVKNSPAKHRNFSPKIYQKRPEILLVYIREWLTLYRVLMFLPFVTTRPFKCNDRMINGLIHSRCLDFQANEKIFILKLALSE